MEKKRILIAEDEKPIAHALELKLSNKGFDVTVVDDGEAAIEILEKNDFDLLLLDLVLPKKDGFDVLAAMQDKNIFTPVIVSSNLSQEEDLDRAKKLGAKDYFMKSNTSIEEVVEHVNKALE
jgi:DNA-binding response OmpR family regulator